MEFLLYPLAFALLLGVLVAFHEYGHFVVARMSGVHVLRFSIGFGKPLFSWVDSKGTEFTLAMIPLGGFVSMYDERDPLTDPKSSPELEGAMGYTQLTPYWRIAIALAGPFANFLLAILIYWLLFFAGSVQYAPMSTAPDEGSLLQRNGMQSAVQVLSVDEVSVTGWQDIALALTKRLGDSGDLRLALLELESGAEREVALPISGWLKGEDDPDIFGSLGLMPSILPVIGRVVEDSQAQRAGLEEGDWIVAVDGKPVTYWSDWVQAIEGSPNTPLILSIIRSGIPYELRATPDVRTVEVADESQDGSGNPTTVQIEQGFLGVGPLVIEVEYPLGEALQMGFDETLGKTSLTFSMITKMFTGAVSANTLVGPVGIAKIAGQSAKSGWRTFFGIMALMSISLAVLNLLPVPMLDGGHVVFILAEIIRGKPVSEGFQSAALQGGLFLVALMFIFVTFNDLSRLI
ncbi:RIP metalloprotease RseP [Pseudomonadales bacterium]|nr:RIP metalloprotease RseP [Pseudomonadales bacterium]MDA8702891.1 RIP metalloprotease RseP [Pseudomonadales bacterium]MDA8952516.1 RIP metalloprotease RseP [Pseudomonadales bacterium]MDB2595239.1 RIP metalloprotease RseP [Pseudomonadales bacterium]